MIATLDERHIARGYDPYNSADQPSVMRAAKEKRESRAHGYALMRGHPDHPDTESDAEIDAKIRRGLQYLEKHPELAMEIGTKAQEIARRKFP